MSTTAVVWSLAASENWTVEVDPWQLPRIRQRRGDNHSEDGFCDRATAGSLVEEGKATVHTAEDDAGTDITLAPNSDTIEFAVVGLAATTRIGSGTSVMEFAGRRLHSIFASQ